MKKNKAMTQEVWKTSVLYSKTSEEFYHHIKFCRCIMNRLCEIFVSLLCWAQKFSFIRLWTKYKFSLKNPKCPESLMKRLKENFKCWLLARKRPNVCLLTSTLYTFVFLNEQERRINHIHNILILFDVLPNFLFITSETMDHYYL